MLLVSMIMASDDQKTDAGRTGNGEYTLTEMEWNFSRERVPDSEVKAEPTLGMTETASAGCDGNDIAQARRHVGLAGPVVTPGHHRAVASESQVVVSTGGDGDDVAQPIRHGCLAGIVGSPADDGAIRDAVWACIRGLLRLRWRASCAAAWNWPAPRDGERAASGLSAPPRPDAKLADPLRGPNPTGLGGGRAGWRRSRTTWRCS